MKIIYDATEKLHQPGFYLSYGKLRQHLESPERMQHLLACFAGRGHEVIAPRDHGDAAILAVHTARYIDFLQTAHARWQELSPDSPEVVPNVHPDSLAVAYPQNVIAQAGFHLFDTSSPIGPDTWTAARAAANAACEAARLVLGGERAAYCLARPPGHHASAERGGGFCYLNNAAIAAQYLRAHVDRVAILDLDVHHGNGTQSIFYERADVMYASIHAHPGIAFPFYTGHASETGSGEGEGCNLNLPLGRGTSDAEYLFALDRALDSIAIFRPDMLVISLGLDASENDPYQLFRVTTKGFAEIGSLIGSMNMPVVIVQEGGYLCGDIEEKAASFLDGFI